MEAENPTNPPAEGEANAEAAPTAPVATVVSLPERGRKSHVAPALIALDRVEEDFTFRLRPEGELSLLATDLARLGQLFPVDLRLRPPDRFQIVCGFRRVAALRFLQRDKVLARLHTDLSDEDALLMALASAIHGQGVGQEELSMVRARLQQEGRLTSTARDMLDKALSGGDELGPESVEDEEEQEVDADELAANVTLRLGELNQDLSLLADVFGSLDEERKAELLEQLRYSAELVAFLEGR
ncbi:MAG: ParB N-terminal domain-containing protein [Myxococcota bacterium]